MIRDSMYENRGRQEDRRKKREEEKQKRALKNALAAGRSAYDPGDALLMGEDEIVANAREWNRKADFAAEKAEKFAQSAIRAEAAGDMGTAAFLWGDSQKSDRNAQKCRREAMRYENMLQTPGTAPKPMSVKPAKGMKSAALPSAPPGAVTQDELAAGQEKAVWAVPDKGRQESAPASIHAGRIALEQDLNRLRSELQMYSKLSGGKGEPWILGWYADQIHDVMKAMEALPAEPVREDILLQALKGNYYTGQPTPEGAAAQVALGMSGLDFPMDIRDLSYDLTHLRTISPGQLGLDALALLPVAGGLKYADEAAALWKQGQNAAEALADAAKHGDDLVDAGKATETLTEAVIAQRKAEILEAIEAQIRKSGVDPADPAAVLDPKALEEYNNLQEAYANAAQNAAKAGDGEFVTYYRVQTPGDHGSKELIMVNEDGTITFDTENFPVKNTSVSAYNTDHATIYAETGKRAGQSYVVAFDVPVWFDEFIRENAILQRGASNSPLSKGGTAPKMTDIKTMGFKFELPSFWNEWLEKYAVNARKIDGGDLP